MDTHNTTFRAIVFTIVGATLILALLLAASVFAAPNPRYSGAYVGNDKYNFEAPSNSQCITYYGSTYETRFVIAIGSNVTVLASSGGKCTYAGPSSVYYIVGYIDSANAHYIYIYDKRGELVKSCNIAQGSENTYIVSPRSVVMLLFHKREGALNFFVDNVLPAINNKGTGNIIILYGNFSGNQPLTLGFTIAGQTVHAFTWGGGDAMEAFWFIYRPGMNSSVISTNNYNFTAYVGHTYFLHDENWANATDTSNNTDNNGTITITFIVKDEFGNNLSAHVEIKNSTVIVFTGNSSTQVVLPANETYYVTVSLTGYKTKTFTVTPTEDTSILVTLEREKEAPEYCYVNIKTYDAETGNEVTGASISGDFGNIKAFTEAKIPCGRHYVQVKAGGYKTLYATFTVSGNTTIPVYLAKTDSGDSGGFTRPVNITNINNMTTISGGWGLHIVNKLNETVNVEIFVRVGVNTGFGTGADIKVGEITLNAHTGYYYVYAPPKPSANANIVFTVVVNGKPYATVQGVYNKYITVNIESEESKWWGGTVVTPSGSSPFGWFTGSNLFALIMLLIIFAILFRALDEL